MSKYLILDKNGKEHIVNKNNIEKTKILKKHPLLLQFVKDDLYKEARRKKPEHLEIMKKLELLDNEPSADAGMKRWYPNGKLMKDLLEAFVRDIVIKEHTHIVETPLMYRTNLKEIKEHMKKFGERWFKVLSGDTELMLRFAACFGMFEIMKDMVVTHKQLPFKMFEQAISFRREQRGECVGLRRLRLFYMPDIHTACADIDSAKKEYIHQLKISKKAMKIYDIKFAPAFRIVKEFYEENKDFMKKIVDIVGASFIEILPERKFYWLIKSEYNAGDTTGGCATLSTTQIDIENAERFGIKYVDRNGKKQYPIILHTAFIGSIDRSMYAILENAALMEKKGKLPRLPLWLAPEQVRLLPLADRHFKLCEKIADEFEKHNIRIGIDDRRKSTSKKVFDAKNKWVPYIIVVGDREAKSGKLNVMIRKKSSLKKDAMESISMKQLIREISDKTKNLPKSKMYVPRLMSKRGIFVAWSKK